MSFVCQAGLIVPCRNEPVGYCDYCGRRFCAGHGRFIQSAFPFRRGETVGVCRRHVRIYRREERIWSGWQSRQKQMDLAFSKHRELAFARNGQGLCGHPNCKNPGKYICDSLPGSCGACYCHLHIRDASLRVCEDCDRYHARTRHIADEASHLVAEIREPFEK